MKKTRELLKLLRMRIFQVFGSLFILLLLEIFFVNTFYEQKLSSFMIADILSQIQFLLVVYVILNLIAALLEKYFKNK
jgi:hypothetical protein